MAQKASNSKEWAELVLELRRLQDDLSALEDKLFELLKQLGIEPPGGMIDD